MPVDHCARCDCKLCSSCLQPPSPPALPPFEQGATISHSVRVIVRAAGAVDDYAPPVIDQIRFRVATSARVALSAVTTTVTPGSVLLTTLITTSDSLESAAVASELRTRVSSIQRATDLLGVTVQAVEEVSVQAQTTDVASDSGGSEVLIGIVVAVAVVICLAAVAFYGMRRRVTTPQVIVKDVPA